MSHKQQLSFLNISLGPPKFTQCPTCKQTNSLSVPLATTKFPQCPISKKPSPFNIPLATKTVKHMCLLDCIHLACAMVVVHLEFRFSASQASIFLFTSLATEDKDSFTTLHVYLLQYYKSSSVLHVIRTAGY